ncbi:MAG: AAA family ATPase, partial [Anaerolineae bacterium]
VTGSVDTEADAGASMLLLYDWLSDGERSFLARMALFALFRADNLLILLDEPEVHFNDVWKREIVQKLDEIMRGCTSHAIITTHSSIVLSDVPSDDVLVLRRDGKFTSGEEHDAGINTFGADPSDIMVHVFGTLSPNGERSRTIIREEIGRRDTAAALTELSNFVAPGYWRYRIQLEAQSRKQ